MLVMLVERAGFRVVSYPKGAARTFRWFESVELGSICPVQMNPSFTLKMCDANSGLDYLKQPDNGCILLALPGETLPEELQSFRDRIIHVDASPSDRQLKLAVGQIFMQSMAWESQIKFMSDVSIPLSDILDLVSSILGGFMFVAGVDKNMVAFSAGMTPPSERYRLMVEEQQVADSIFSDVKVSSPKGSRSPMETEGDVDEDGLVCMRYPLVFNTTYFGVLGLVVPQEMQTDGVRQAFMHFAEKVYVPISKKWSRGVEVDLPHYFFLTSLLRGEQYSKEAVEANLDSMGIPLHAQYKIILLDTRECAFRSVGIMTSIMSKLNDGRNYCVLYEDYLVCICYSDLSEDATLSHKKTVAQLREHVYGTLGVVCGISQVFDRITDIDNGFLQAKYALAYRDTIQRELYLMDGREPQAGVCIEAVFPYLYLDANALKPEFLEFFLSHTLLEKLIAEDLAYGSRNFALLWYFLAYERNASKAGRRLYMHRNSVLYHIKQIEKRFDFDLSDQFFREKLTMECRIQFLRMKDSELDRLFAPEQKRNFDMFE